MLHPTAQIDPGARLGAHVSVGAFTVIGAEVDIGEGTHIGSHCVLTGPTRIGRDNRIYSHAVLGGDPQDKKFGSERSELIIGDRNTIREFTTFNRGTGEAGVTCIGDDNWIMAYVHIAHDCRVGNHTILANNATLAGHVSVDDWAILGGFAGIHQFCKIGAHAFIGMGSLINADVPPFVLVAEDKYAKPRGINIEGLKRRGFDASRIAAIKLAYRTLFVSGKPMADVKQELADSAQASEDIRQILDFIENSERGLLR